MEQHPIPQNVSQYQFRLIGDMTIKQFVMLAAGIILGLLMSKAPLIPDFLRWPMAGLLAGGGAALAFLPFEERSLDVWLINFIKSIYRPTYFLWQKSAVLPEYFTFTRTSTAMPIPQIPHGDRQRLSAYLQSLKTTPQNQLDHIENDALTKINTVWTTATLSQAQPTGIPLTKPGIGLNSPTQPQSPITPFPMAPNIAKINSMSQIPPLPQPPVTTTQPPFPANSPAIGPTQVATPQPATINPAFQPITPTQSQLGQTPSTAQPQPPQHIQRQGSAQQLIYTQKPLGTPLTQQPTHHVEPAPPLTPPMMIKSLYPTKIPPKKVSGPQYLSDVQMPISPDIPNVIIGMTLTRDERLLPNTILEIRDKDGLPIRAIKSNQLGQFFIATPLINGHYALIAEHPDYTFNTIAIEAKGEILAPIKVISQETYREAL